IHRRPFQQPQVACEEIAALILALVVLQRQPMTLLHLDQLARIRVGMCPPDLEAPRLVDVANLVHSVPYPLREHGSHRSPSGSKSAKGAAGKRMRSDSDWGARRRVPALLARRAGRAVRVLASGFAALGPAWVCAAVATNRRESGTGHRGSAPTPSRSRAVARPHGTRLASHRCTTPTRRRSARDSFGHPEPLGNPDGAGACWHVGLSDDNLAGGATWAHAGETCCGRWSGLDQEHENITDAGDGLNRC